MSSFLQIACVPTRMSSSVVHLFKCSGCNGTYIAETTQHFIVRHKLSINKKDEKIRGKFWPLKIIISKLIIVAFLMIFVHPLRTHDARIVHFAISL